MLVKPTEVQPVFVKTRRVLDSYQDLWRLVELSGYETCYSDEMDLEAEKYYVTTPFTGELERRVLASFPKNRKAFIIFWNLERPDHYPMDGETNKSLVRSVTDYALHRGADRVWISDMSILHLDGRLIYAMVGGHPLLREETPGSVEAFDLCHMSYVWGRREGLLSSLGKTLKIAPASWGAERAKALAGSKAILNIHQRDVFRVTAPLRFALAAAYGLPIFSEGIDYPYPLEDGKSILMANYSSLEERVKEWLKRDDLREIGERARVLLTEKHTFRKEVQMAMTRTLFPDEVIDA